ncbi:MAG: ribonuclease HIII [Acidaminococcus sp.]|nr:ribonuclease HIII [Acidaminococcus sp.]MCI2099427.1 ribonuclease HIII [Acidaminococcus sp.]MCI2113787.1 ribonuclease HIII [Acidaminococcus sp.]MCI2115639.1 ribonuclease HIII [Acidaminococcus sp.]
MAQNIKKNVSFENWVQEAIEKLQPLAAEPIAEKAINYGVQLTIKDKGQDAKLNLYHGKKGFTMTWGGKDTPFRASLQEALEKPAAQGEASGPLVSAVSLLDDIPGFDGVWAGSDESGKGDFFGPLVVAAVCVNREIASAFRQAGVRDSKALTDAQIGRLAKQIKEQALAVKVLALPPDLYNKRYQWFKERGCNLNQLLANGHVQALSGVLTDVPSCHFALVDRFAVHNKITERLTSQFVGLTVRQQPRAEADMAVAAASILARDEFVRIMKQLGMEAGMELPKGGGAQATQTALVLEKKVGRKKMPHFVKMHFANAGAL